MSSDTKEDKSVSIEEKIDKSDLTEKQKAILEAWVEKPTSTLQEIADKTGTKDGTVSEYIKYFGWLYDEELWLERSWRGEPEEVKKRAIQKKKGGKSYRGEEIPGGVMGGEKHFTRVIHNILERHEEFGLEKIEAARIMRDESVDVVYKESRK